MALIKILLIIFFIYYVLKFFGRLFGPLLMKKAVSKMQQKAEERFAGFEKKPEVKEGETIIDKKPQNNQTSKNDVGDYVDFEEIE